MKKINLVKLCLVVTGLFSALFFQAHLNYTSFNSIRFDSIGFNVAEASVYVHGYTRANGTYVEPYYRSSPDSSPYNNYSFPGNTNPYTGKVAPGNADTYLNNYYNNSSTYTFPTYTAPDYTLPTYTTPTYSLPTYTTPDYTLPTYTAPTYTSPTYTTPDYTLPTYTLPTYTAPTLTCGLNSHSTTGTECKCDTGYSWSSTDAKNLDCSPLPTQTLDQQCQSQFGTNSYGKGTLCYCNKGYGFNSGKTQCVAQDINPPSDIADLQAEAQYMSVNLTWSPSIDDVGIKDYIVAYDTKPIIFSDYSTNDKAPNAKHFTQNNPVIKNLENGTTYYFYVLPVDTSGNWSIHWSNTATSIPKDDTVIIPVHQDVTTTDPSNLTNDNQTVNPFSDLPDDNKNKTAILYLENKGIIKGYDDQTFKPEVTITRAELLKILIEAKGIHPTYSDYNSCFTDSGNEWYTPYLCYAKSVNWITGYDDGSSKPTQAVNKAEALKILLNSQNIATTTIKDKPFYDVPADDWSAPFIAKAKELGILEEDGSTFDGLEGKTRASISENLYRLLTKVAK